MIGSFVAKLKVYRFFDDFIIIYPLYTLMFESGGLNVSQISILLLAWSAISFVLEIPSGVFADKYDRKTILIVAQLTRVLGFSIWLLFPTFWGFLLGFVFWGIKSAFTSGTLDAFLYDGLKADGMEDDYSKILGSLKSLSFIAILLASVLASALFFLGYKTILILSIIALVISAFALVTAKSRKITKSTEEVEYFSLLKEGFKEFFSNSKLLVLILVSAIFIGAMAVDEYFTLYVSNVNVPTMLVGYLLALYSLIQAFGSYIAHKFDSRKNLYALLGLFSVSIFMIGFASSYAGVIIFMLLALVSSVGQIVSNTAIQKATKSHVRATVSSVAGFLAELIAFSAYIVIWLVPSEDLKTGLIIYGLFVILITFTTFTLSLLNKKQALTA